MTLSVTRVYKNASGDTIRIDNIYLEATGNPLTMGVLPKTYARHVSTSVVHATGVSRTVAGIELLTSADTIETVSGDYKTATWTTINAGVPVICDMSDLPGISDTV